MHESLHACTHMKAESIFVPVVAESIHVRCFVPRQDKAAAMVLSTQSTSRSVQDVLSTNEAIKAMRVVAGTALGQHAGGADSPRERTCDGWCCPLGYGFVVG